MCPTPHYEVLASVTEGAKVSLERKGALPPHASCARLLCEKVSGDVVGLAPLVEPQQLDLSRTKVRRVRRAHHTEGGLAMCHPPRRRDIDAQRNRESFGGAEHRFWC
eukprot:3411845-Amphidinium_carterae.1